MDKLDRRILYELGVNARVQASDLARKYKRSKQTIGYRIDKLEEEKIILGYYPIVDVSKLGYVYCRVAITLQHMSKEDEEDMKKCLCLDEDFFWIFSTQGEYDVLLVSWCKSIQEFRKIVEKLRVKWGKFIADINESVATNVIHYDPRYVTGSKKTQVIEVGVGGKVEIDEVDERILKVLCNNARQNLMDLHKKIDESPTTIRYRMKKMEKNGLIKGYRALVDHKKLGYAYYKLWVDVTRFTKKGLVALYTYLQSHPAVLYRVEGIGFPKFLDIEVMAKDTNELIIFMRELRGKYPQMIGHYKSFIFIDTLKVKYYPF